ncbi:uncharacterized protein EAE98_006986 [Botrytis deweyae]|uniref:Rhodopsin domain-containing protein n=1 Tax=Botrytis deweyae TaxID=2478750 RepID=A0ABQ7IJ98_9HELO|nr:uncharacterized protein EAE98_006986 [Botrytis deweyae]KAF7925761.1 hypothetical protein EAE98_006986 [Botrytis deweyae]
MLHHSSIYESGDPAKSLLERFPSTGLLLVIPGGNIGFHQWDVSLLNIISKRNLVALYMNLIFLQPALGTMKLSIFITYLEIFQGLRWMQICVYIGATFSTAFYLALTIVQFYAATPVGGGRFAKMIFMPRFALLKRITFAVTGIALAIDIYLFVLPLIAVSKLRIPTRRKIFVMIGFGIGLSACICAALSFVYRYIDHWSTDTTWTSLPVIVLTSVELFCGIIIACFPSLLLFFRRHYEHFANAGAALLSWLRCDRHRKSDTTTKESQYSSYPSERTPAGEVNLYPDLDFLTTPGDIERTALEKRMENRIGLDVIAV